MVTGRLDGTVDGRPVSLVAENGDLILEVSNLLVLLALRRNCPFGVKSLLAKLKLSDVRLKVRIGWLGTVEVSPQPRFIVRLLLPH